MSPVVTVARGWIGTPYRHQAARKGAGCDCLGLVRGVWAELSGGPLEPVPAYTPDWSEPAGDEALLRGLSARMGEKPTAQAVPGDLLLFRMRQGSVAKHLGILSQAGPAPRFIHAYQGHGVIETALSAPWQRRLVAVFSFPKLN